MWCGLVWCGVILCGLVWCDVVWCGLVWCGVKEITQSLVESTNNLSVGNNTKRFISIQYNTIQNHLVAINNNATIIQGCIEAV